MNDFISTALIERETAPIRAEIRKEREHTNELEEKLIDTLDVHSTISSGLRHRINELEAEVAGFKKLINDLRKLFVE